LILGWEVGYTPMQLTEPGQTFFKRNHFSAWSMHQDHVTVIPPGFTNLASSEKSKYQVLIKEKQMISFQAHPEYNAEIIRDIVEYRYQKGIFNLDFRNKCLETIDSVCDSTWMVQQLIEFIT
jgi:GMP synthase-like glutamine amidotransferase